MQSMTDQLYENIFAHNESYEKRRKFIVKAVFFIYLLSLLEGPLRKWFLPGLAAPLTLLRDPFVISLYAYCLLNRFIMRNGVASLWLRFAVITSCFGLIQYMFSGYPLEGWMLGVRSYWLYMPLAFIVAVTFRPEDITRFLKLNLWIALPYAVLVSAQYNAGPTAFINRGVGGDELAAVSLSMGIVRPFGLFTYISPNVDFTAAMTAILIATYLARFRERPNPLVFLAMAVAVATMGILTGSRFIYFSVAITLGFTIFGLMWTGLKSKTLIRVLSIGAFLALAGLLFVNVFPDMLEAMEVRIERASNSEGSIWNRIYYSGFTFLDALQTAPILGHGIGLGASGVVKFLGLSPLLYGEADTQRNINELGVIFGIIFLIMRWFTSLWLLKNAIRLARNGLPMVLPLAGYAAFPLSFGQITNSPIIGFLPWLFFGMVLAYQNATANSFTGWILPSTFKQ